MRRLRRWTLRGLAAGTLALVALAGYLALLQATGNLHTVAPGEVLRSNQPTPARLAALVRDHGLRSVLNLRGAAPGAEWYEAEAQAARDLGLVLIDFPLSASDELGRPTAEALLAALRDAPKPLLIHCRSGADRTGLASSIYQTQVMGLDEETAEWQLSILYGHIGLPYLSDAWPMDVTWEAIERWWGLEHA